MIQQIFGNRVRENRLQKGLSQDELAFATGIDRPQISKIEQGKSNPTLETIEKLANALEIDYHELFTKDLELHPFVKWAGGKTQLLDKLHSLMPAKFNNYYEPFVGGGALYFYLEPNKAVINDINKRLIDFYLTVKNRFKTLKNELFELESIYNSNQSLYENLKSITNSYKHVPNENEALYYKLRNMYNGKVEKEYLDATLYYFINKTSYSGMIRFNSKGEYNVPFGRYKRFNTDLLTFEHHKLLQSSEILNLDYSEVFNRCKSNDFIFLDPPYDCIFNDYGNIEKDEFDEDEQVRLCQNFKNLSCKALMVIGKTKLTESLYKGLIKESYQKSYSVNIRNRFKSESEHLIITNY